MWISTGIQKKTVSLKWDSNFGVNKDVTDPHFSKFPVLFWYTYHSASIQPVKASGKHQEQSNPTLWWLEPSFTQSKWPTGRSAFAFFPDVPLAPRGACMLSCFSHDRLFLTLWTVACQALLSMGFSRQEYWSRLPCLLPGDLLTQGSNQCLLCLLNLHLCFLLQAPPGKPPGKLLPVSYFITLGSFAYGFQRHEQKMSQIGLILQNKLNWALFVWLGFYYLLGEF